jgi:hypothetical protein
MPLCLASVYVGAVLTDRSHLGTALIRRRRGEELRLPHHRCDRRSRIRQAARPATHQAQLQGYLNIEEGHIRR